MLLTMILLYSHITYIHTVYCKGLSVNHVEQIEGMKSTFFSALGQTLFLVNRVEHQKLN